jgi:D-sedoheptulose 7-phosphate isomerase
MPVERGSLASLTEDYVSRLQGALEALPRDRLDEIGSILGRAYRNGKRVFTIGNGGSASLASHMAADLSKNTIRPNMRRFRIMSLNDNASIVTALANDLGYENIFSEQLTNLIRAGDVLVVVSASGNSPNIIKAIEYAGAQCAEVIALLGFDGGKAATMADVSIVVSSWDYGIVEDTHLIINHILVEYFRERFARDHPWVV